MKIATKIQLLWCSMVCNGRLVAKLVIAMWVYAPIISKILQFIPSAIKIGNIVMIFDAWCRTLDTAYSYQGLNRVSIARQLLVDSTFIPEYCREE